MSTLDALADRIAATNPCCVFGVPGSGPSLTLLDALERKGIPFHRTQTEGAAVLMAGTAGRLTGRAHPAIAIKGPGLANMLPGIAACALEHFPVVTVSEAYAPDVPHSKAHKRLDHPRVLDGLAKAIRFFSSSGPAYDELARHAEAEVPGPVHLDIAAAPIDAANPLPRADACPIDPAAEDAVRTAIDRAERPAVIAGTLAIRRGWHDWLNGLGVPVFSTAAAKGVVDETRPHAAGVYTGVGQPLSPEAVLLQDADLVIGLGLRHSEVLSAAALPCPAVNIDCAGPEHWNGFGFTAVAAPSDALVDQLRACLSDRQPDGTAERIAGCRTAMLTRLRGEAFLPAQAFEALSSTLPDAGFVMDTGLYCTVGEHVLQARTPQTCLLAGQSRYMGTGIPMALGAAAVAPDRPTVAIVGDGGIAMAVGELKLAVELELPLLVVLMSDGNLGTLRPRARKDGLTEAPMRIDQPSWRAVLDGMGIPGAAAATGQELADALAGIGPIKAPRYLELTFDPDHYITMCDGVR